MKCFTKISLVVLSCFTLAKSQDLNQFVNDLLGKSSAEVAGVNANPTEINNEYTPEDIRKYTKFLINVINGDNQPAQIITTTTTSLPQPTTPASNLLEEVRDLTTELDQIKERKVDEIYEIVDILKNVSSRLETLEDTVENLTKQEQEPEIPNTIPDNGVVDLDNAEIDVDAAEPVKDDNLKYVTIFNELNKQNEEKIASMQESQIKILGEIKDLLAANNKAAAAEPVEEPVVNVNGDAKAVVEVTEANLSSEVNAAPAPETTEESIKEQLALEDEEFNKLYDDIKQNINDYKKALSRKVSADEQFTLAAVIRDKSKTIKQYINKLTSLAKTEDQKAKVKEINDKYDNAESDQIEIANNDEQVVNDEAAAKESVEGAKNIVTVDHMKKIINNVAASTTNEEQVEEVRRILKEIQLDDVETKAENEAQAENVDINELVGDALEKVASNTVNEEQVEDVREFIKTIEANQAAEANAEAENAGNVDVDALVNDALQKVAANTVNEEQVEEVREFIKSIEANKILDDNLKKDEVVKNLIFNIASSTTNDEQVKQVQRIIEKMQLFDKFAEDNQQEQEDNLAFGLRMAEEIQKSPEEITNDLKDMLVNLVNNAKTDEDAANIANIIDQIKKHDELIKEAAEEESGDIKVPNAEAYVIDLGNGDSNEIYLKEDYDFLDNAKPEEPAVNGVPIVESVPKIELEIDDTEESGNGKGVLILGALGVIALAGAGYTYRSKAKKMNDEFPFSDSNLPFSNSMNGLVVDKHFLFNKKNSIPMPEHIVSNDAVIRPSQPSWATSMLMDENNKKGLKEKNLQMTEDPEELLDEQLREIQNKEKVIVKPNTPAVVINIDENGVTTKEPTEAPKKSKKVKKPKLRRSMGSMTLDKKAKEGKEEASDKKSKKHKKDKVRKTKSMFVESKKDDEVLDEELERSLNTSFILDVPPNLFEEMENEKNKKLLNVEKPKVPKRISSCVSIETNIDKAIFEKAKAEKAKVEKVNNEKEMSDCPFTDEFTKEIMEDYNKKFVEMEKEN